MITKDALEYLIGQGESKDKVEVLFDAGNLVHKAIFHGDTYTIEKFDKGPECFLHKFDTIEGFKDFFETDLVDKSKTIPVFVNKDKIEANLAYGTHNTRRALIHQQFTDEFKAMSALAKETEQKQVWRALISDLSGKIRLPGVEDPGDKTLLSLVQSIQFSSKQEGETKIDVTGIQTGSTVSSINVTFPTKQGSQTATIPLDWQFHGRVYRSFDQQTTIDLRLEITKDLKFVFHLIHLSDVLDNLNRQLVEHLKAILPTQCVVFEGEF